VQFYAYLLANPWILEAFEKNFPYYASNIFMHLVNSDSDKVQLKF